MIISKHMAGTLSPIPASAQNLEGPMPSRVHSPTKPLFLGPNDDKLERARARAERAAAIRRRSINAIAPPPTPPDTDPCLGKQQILDLFQNCIKLASENVCTLSLSLFLLIIVLRLLLERFFFEYFFSVAPCTSFL